MPPNSPIAAVPGPDVQYLRRLAGVGGIPYVTNNPVEIGAIAELWVDGMIEAQLPPISPGGWQGTAAVIRIRQRGWALLRERGLL